MEKMNQISVSEFFAKSKEEMYDDAVAMVEKYNRLIDRHTVYTDALNTDIADKAAKIELLEKEIEGRKEGYIALKARMDTKYISIEEHNNICEDFKKKIEEKLKKESEKWQDLAKMNRDTICNQYDVCEDFKNKIAELEEENEKLKVDLIHEREKNEKLAKDHAELENDMRKSSVEVSDKDKVIADLEESKRYWKRQSINDQDEINHWKDQERIRTDQLRATESKVEELWEEIERLRDLGEHWKRSYFNIRYSLNKLKDESKEDDYGKSGFKRYIEHLIEEEERAVPERFKERLNKEITEIFTKEEETEVKGNGRTSSGRYPWGAKVNDIPCGEDAIE